MSRPIPCTWFHLPELRGRRPLRDPDTPDEDED
jgi:hypothetical protein